MPRSQQCPVCIGHQNHWAETKGLPSSSISRPIDKSSDYLLYVELFNDTISIARIFHLFLLLLLFVAYGILICTFLLFVRIAVRHLIHERADHPYHGFGLRSNHSSLRRLIICRASGYRQRCWSIVSLSRISTIFFASSLVFRNRTISRFAWAFLNTTLRCNLCTKGLGAPVFLALIVPAI